MRYVNQTCPMYTFVINVFNHIAFCSDTLFMKEMLLNKPLKMVIPQEKAQSVSWFIETKSDR